MQGSQRGRFNVMTKQLVTKDVSLVLEKTTTLI